MKRMTILGIIACVGLLFGPAAVLGNPAGPPGGLDVNVVGPDPLPVTGTVNVSTVYRFAEFSSTPTNGNTGGIGGMHSICQTDLEDSSARMCTTKELLLSPNIPFGSSLSPAWAQPTIVTTTPVDGNLSHFDYSGTFYSTDEGTCFQWTIATSDTGLTQGMAFAPGVVGSSTGFVGVTACNRSLPVACCTPVN